MQNQRRRRWGWDVLQNQRRHALATDFHVAVLHCEPMCAAQTCTHNANTDGKSVSAYGCVKHPNQGHTVGVVLIVGM